VNPEWTHVSDANENGKRVEIQRLVAREFIDAVGCFLPVIEDEIAVHCPRPLHRVRGQTRLLWVRQKWTVGLGRLAKGEAGPHVIGVRAGRRTGRFGGRCVKKGIERLGRAGLIRRYDGRWVSLDQPHSAAWARGPGRIMWTDDGDGGP
jgi:hypothetical protein